MKKTMKFLSMAALALMGAVMAGCSSDDNIIDEPQRPTGKSNIVTLTTTISLDGGAATTRALTSGGVKTFAAGETMALLYNNGSYTVKAESHPLEAANITNEGKSATFTFDLEETPNKSESVTYVYPAAMVDDYGDYNYNLLNSQDGTLETLASNLDLATYSGAWNGENLPANVTLDNQLAILAVTLKDDAATPADITSSITGMTVSDGTYDYTVSRTAAAGPIYVAIWPTSSANIEVTATDGTNMYIKLLTDKTYAESNGYNLSWRMTNMINVPLTLVAKYDYSEITVSNPQSGMQYTVNGGEKQPVTSSAISVNKGDRVAFYGNGTSITTYGGYIGTKFSCDYDYKVYGNIMSLVDETGFATATSLEENAFYGLFKSSTYLTDASSLLLPATTLARSCYQEMFYKCISLTKAPVLSAKTLAEYCYYNMFYRCSSLRSVTCLATDISAYGCTNYWLSGVDSEGTFTKAAGVDWSEGDSGIPSGWTVKEK